MTKAEMEKKIKELEAKIIALELKGNTIEYHYHYGNIPQVYPVYPPYTPITYTYLPYQSAGTLTTNTDSNLYVNGTLTFNGGN